MVNQLDNNIFSALKTFNVTLTMSIYTLNRIDLSILLCFTPLDTENEEVTLHDPIII